MSKKVQAQVQLLIPDGVINGFCYPFAKALLEKLKKLKEEDKIFEDGRIVAEKSPNNGYAITELASVVVGNLIENINHDAVESVKEIYALIETAEEFLAIFEKK